MFPFETLAAAYFLALLLVSLLWPGRRRAAVAAGGMVLLVVLAAAFAPLLLREWLPHVWLLAGYRLPGLLVQAPRVGPGEPLTRFEAWLRRTDTAIRPRLPRLPAWLALLTDTAYLFCYPLVPLSFASVWWFGTQEDITRYWLAVLLAGYVSYVSLPWLLSRPPRLVERDQAAGGVVQELNVTLLGHLSHGWNSFPSGHVAVAFAAAWSVACVWPMAGVAIGLVATAVATGAVAGRYHYVIDVIAGVGAGMLGLVILDLW